MSEACPIIGGVYRHFKGNEYTVIGVAKHSETEEELVIYKKNHEPIDLWARPRDMFCDEVEKPEINYRGPRFRLIKNPDV